MHTFYDRLYGPLEISADDLRLYQTPELTRLRRVSLSAVAPWIIPTTMSASKFEHSVGTAHLARLVGTRPEFADIALDLYFAALAHDLGTPPFSHTTEHFQVALTGMNHEEYVDKVLAGSAFADEVKRQGGSVERVAALVKGSLSPWSDLLNGSIDVDNLDNTLRYGLSMGLLDHQSYEPRLLAQAYAWRDDQLVFAGDVTEALRRWDLCRRDVYRYIYSQANLAPAVMVWQALYLVMEAGKLPEEFFHFTDDQAFNWLLEQPVASARQLVERARDWRWYERVVYYSLTEPNEQVSGFLHDSMRRGALMLELAGLLKTDPANLCLSVNRNKGVKQVHLPILDGRGEKRFHTPQQQPQWWVQVYAWPEVVDKRQQIQEFVEERLELSPEQRGS